MKEEETVYKMDLNNPPTQEKTTEEVVEEPVEEVKQEAEEAPIIQEVTEEEQELPPVEQPVEEEIENKTPEVELPENIQKVVDFMNETGGTLEDYVRLNADYSNVEDNALLLDYYKSTKPHLSLYEVNFIIEDNFSFDEEVDCLLYTSPSPRD